ncbi:hypothetical protein ACNHKD_07320 [Methylocystis sp. JAN1]|uniref:hypothetical protein n=1 Tax=Methylocystis sp. JAN1 TaxID=3397211 RepID=UPI003FA2B52C
MTQRQTERRPERSDNGRMTVEEAGRLGGEKGGHKGGQRVKELIKEGKRAEEHQEKGGKGAPRR